MLRCLRCSKMINRHGYEKRIEINRKLSRPLSDREWSFLDSQKLLEKLQVGELTSEGIAVKVEQMRATFGEAAPDRKARDREVAPARSRAISELIAQSAAKDVAVLAFRKEVLEGRLLPSDEMRHWILKQAEAEGQPTTLLMVPVPPGTELKFRQENGGLAIAPTKELRVSKDVPAIGTWTDELAFPVGDKVRLLFVVMGGILDRLRILSETLAERYGWHPADTTAFVLTNTPPPVPSISVRHAEREIAALSRVMLTIDPAVSPRQVAEFYRGLRKYYVGNRHRSLSEKHTTLVLFMNSRPADETYADSMAAWNREYRKRKWQYHHATNFGRDVQVARRRLLGSEPQPPSVPGKKEKES